jgi:hypothetical protein
MDFKIGRENVDCINLAQSDHQWPSVVELSSCIKVRDFRDQISEY